METTDAHAHNSRNPALSSGNKGEAKNEGAYSKRNPVFSNKNE